LRQQEATEEKPRVFLRQGAFPPLSLSSVSHHSSWRGHVITSSIAKPVCIKKTRIVPILNVHENRPAIEVRNGEAKRT